MSFFGKKKQKQNSNEIVPPPGGFAAANGPIARPAGQVTRLPEPNGLAASTSHAPPAMQGINGHAAPPNGISAASQPTPANTTIVFPWSRRELHLLPIAHAADVKETSPGGPSPMPFPRYGHSANALTAASNGDIFVFGGLVDGQQKLSNSLYVLHSLPNRPESQTGAPPGSLSIGMVETRGEVPPARFGHASVGVGNVLIVWGGDTKMSEEDETKDNALYLLNLSTREWTRVDVTGNAPECRYGHAAAMVGSRFYIFGGQHADSRFLGDLWAFDLQKLKAGLASWTQIESGGVKPPPRTGHTCVTLNDCLYVFGGTDGQYHYNDTWQYDTNTKTWKELLCIGYIPVPREGHSATLVDDVMYVFGGRGVDGKDLEDLAAFKISNQRWYMFQNMGPAPSGRSGHAMATWQNKVFVLGGESFPPKEDSNHSMIHVLDTGKIKYPQDQNRQSQARKSQPTDARPPTEAPEAARQRSTSPVDRQRPPAQAQSLTQAAMESTARIPPPSIAPLATVAPAPPVAAGQPPKRPARPSEDGNFSPQQRQEATFAAREGARSPPREALLQRSISPPMVRPPAQTAVIPPVAAVVPESAPVTRARTNSETDRVRSPTPPSDSGRAGGMSHANRAERPRDLRIAQKPDASSTWLRAALGQAVSQGYVLPSDSSADANEVETIKAMVAKMESGEQAKVVQAMLGLKQELTRLKGVIARQAANAEAQIAQASQGRTVALQDAIASRAKLAAYERGTDGRAAVNENERMTQLERDLSLALTTRHDLETRHGHLEGELTREKAARTAAESRAIASSQRAEATEASYSRSLKDYAEIQRRAQTHDTTINGHLEQISMLSAALQKAQADHAHAKARLDSSETSLEQYLRTLEQTQTTLTASNAQADEMQSLWVQAKAEATASQAMVIELRAALEAAKHEASTSSVRASELERILDTTRQEHSAMRALTTSGLADLVAASKTAGRAANRDVADAQAQQLRASQNEVQSVKQLHQDARSRHEETLGQLAEHRSRADNFEQQVLALRAEAANARALQASALDEAARAKAALAQRDADLRSRTHQLDSTVATLATAQAILTEHGLAEQAASGSSSGLSSMSPDQLIRRIHDLENRLEAHSRSQQALEAAHDATNRDLRNAEQQVREGLRQRQAHASQMDELHGELERAKSPANASDSGSNANSRAIKAEADLLDLQAKHRGLEASHQKAVQYVKGTEKMLRRMKDELTKHKSRVEELEGQLRSREANNASPADLDALRTELMQMRQYSEQASSENEALTSRIATLQASYDRTLQQKDREHQDITDSLRGNIAELQTKLAETPSLPTSPHMPNGVSANGDTDGLLRELADTRSKIDWLAKEKADLEVKLNDSNGKISLLLDAMERNGAASSLSGHEASSSIGDGSYGDFFNEGRRHSGASGISEELRPELIGWPHQQKPHETASHA